MNGDNLLAALQWCVASIGVAAVVLAIKWAWFFAKSKRRIARSMVRMLIEQMISSVCTLIFALNSLIETVTGEDTILWNSIHPAIAIALRLVMFGAMVHSTLHLSRSVRRILDGEALD